MNASIFMLIIYNPLSYPGVGMMQNNTRGGRLVAPAEIQQNGALCPSRGGMFTTSV